MNGRRICGQKIMEDILTLSIIWFCTGFIGQFLPNTEAILPVSISISVLLLLIQHFPLQVRKAIEYIFQYRWALALLIFIICVSLRLHGSSIGVFNTILPTQIADNKSTIFGTYRWVRSDEFGVATLKYLSQAANKYQMYSQQMSLSPTNMVLDYYSPVWDWTIIGKPLSWGFLLFGNEVGLSWYWCGEIILLFMTALEMCLFLTNRMRLLSFVGAVMITLSPAIQWWIIPHMPPVILYSMALFSIGYHFFTAKGTFARWVTAGLAVIAVTGFALSIFPSFQIPCILIVMILLFVYLLRDRERISFTKRNWFQIILPAAVTLLILSTFLFRSSDDISLLLNTVYPGSRMNLGGERRINDLFTDLTSFFLSYKDINFLNNCEVATYIHFAPLFLVLSPYLIINTKKRRDKNWTTGVALVGIIIVQGLYMLFGFPQWLAEITLFRYCNRMHKVYGWAATLFTIWGLSVLIRYPDMFSKKAKILLPLIYGSVSLFTLDALRYDYFEQFIIRGYSIGKLLIALTLMSIVLILYLAFFCRQKLLSAVLIVTMVFSGFTVNPIERGIGAITNHPVSLAVSQIAEKEPEEYWLCTDSVFILPNYLLANGAKVLNATNFYPDTEKWRILDPTGQYTEVTNRYANETAELTESENNIELVLPDLIKLYLNPGSLKSLGVHYLLTPFDHSELLSRYGISCSFVTGQDGYGIYRLDYPD